MLGKSVQIGDNINNDFFGILGQQVSDFNSRLQSLLEVNKLRGEQGG